MGLQMQWWFFQDPLALLNNNVQLPLQTNQIGFLAQEQGSGSQNVDQGPVAPGHLLKCKSSGPTLTTKSQTLGWGSEICVLTSPIGNSDTQLESQWVILMCVQSWKPLSYFRESFFFFFFSFKKNKSKRDSV